MSIEKKDEEILNAAISTYFLSRHAIDPSCLPLSLLWQKAKQEKKLPSEQEITQAKNLTGWQRVEFGIEQIRLPTKGMGLDFGGFGKEFAVDKVSEILRKQNFENFLINFGEIFMHLEEPRMGCLAGRNRKK